MWANLPYVKLCAAVATVFWVPNTAGICLFCSVVCDAEGTVLVLGRVEQRRQGCRLMGMSGRSRTPQIILAISKKRGIQKGGKEIRPSAIFANTTLYNIVIPYFSVLI